MSLFRIDNSSPLGANLDGLYAANGGPLGGLRNRIINGGFDINQRVVSGTVVLAAGTYGHDRWKAGASGCTYTFATVNGVTTITITAGSLQQVIEDLNLETGTYALSWSGTAQGKIGAGSYAASGITGAVTGGTNTTVEFNAGTLSRVQFELGTTPTVFERLPVGLELSLCQRYFERLPIRMYGSHCTAGTAPTYVTWQFKVPKRATPTITTAGANFSGTSATSIDFTDLFVATAGQYPWFEAGNTASAEL